MSRPIRFLPGALMLSLVAAGCGPRPMQPPADPTPAALPNASPADSQAPAGSDSSPSAAGIAVAPLGSDPRAAEQWALDAVGLPEAWTRSAGGGVVIAIVDTGVDLDHPDLAPKLVAGIDLVDGDAIPDDPNGHGTHVAGIAAAATDNALGIAGAAPAAAIMPVRVLDVAGFGSDETIAAGIQWAATHGADVINLSLGESGFAARLSKGGSINAAIRLATKLGVTVIAAAGNDGSRGRVYRLGVDVIVVNASARDGSAAAFTNTGDLRAIAAPGVDILSTAPLTASALWPDGTDGYASLDGTSMAAPLVSATAALLLAQGVPASDVAGRLMGTASNPGGDPALGAGVLDAAAATSG